MLDYVVQGVRLLLPESLLTPALLKAFETGRYEHLEARQLPRFLRDGDRLLELGAGVGFISSLASRTVKLHGPTVVEANPDLVPVIRTTHQLNGVTADVRNAVALSRAGRDSLGIGSSGEAQFYQRTNFWGSSLGPTPGYKSVAGVPTLDFQTLVRETKPTVIIADIEGGEKDLFVDVAIEGVRHVFLEVHKNVIGLKGIADMAAALAQQGLYYDPDFSVGAVVMFSRDAS